MIPFFDYRPQYARLRSGIDDAIQRVLDSGQLILGSEVDAFESEFASFVGVGGAVGVNSGTDALIVALRALGIGAGDEVITVANAGTPVVAAIRATGAMPRFVDVDPVSLQLAPERLGDALSERTRCVIPVHLYGQPAPIETIAAFAEQHELALVEDCAQAHGARVGGRHVGTFGRVGCFSFYPTKNLGAFGDGGICISDDPELLERLRLERMYGYRGDRSSQIEGINTRLDEIQAAILRVKLSRLDGALDERRRLARRYLDGLATTSLTLPAPPPTVEHAFHLFVVRHDERDRVGEQLSRCRIGWAVHYPQPVHRMPAYRFLAYDEGRLPVTEQASRSVLSLPLYPGLEDQAVDRVIEALTSLA
ncbi:MAG TPA: DegT/DnrJ/EryC1/StrS family aminotransferase, partial [Candidatus Polarisedimenticolaceae bacterium]|nr:DegT/DnrJ/EryC1/StrS family aminotransferase [Candidatus Polarisedimenticolaceae bacterium]